MPELRAHLGGARGVAGAGDLAARMLSLWSPPPYLTGCTQAALAGPSPRSVRNYDYAPRLLERVVGGTASHRPPGGGHERLPLGPRGRHERGRPGPLAGLRRPACRGRGLRHPPRPALRARDVRHRARGAPGARAPARAHGLQPDGRLCGGRADDRRAGAPAARRASPPGRRRRTTRRARSGPSRSAPRAASSARPSRSTSWPTRTWTRPRSSRPSSGPRSTRRPTTWASAPSTPPCTGRASRPSSTAGRARPGAIPSPPSRADARRAPGDDGCAVSGEWSAVALAAALRRRELRPPRRSTPRSSAPTPIERRSTRSPSGSTTGRGGPRARADAALARGEGGPLCGVPVTTKDSHWMAGVETTSGSRARAGFVPDRDGGRDRAARGGRRGDVRPDHGARVLLLRHHRVRPFRAYLQPLEPRPHRRAARPAARRSRSPPARAALARRRRRRLDPDPGRVLRHRGFKPTFGLVPHEPSSRGLEDARRRRPDGPHGRGRPAHAPAVAGPTRATGTACPRTGLDAPAPGPGGLRVAVSEDLGFAPLDDDVRRAFRAAVAALEAAGVQLVRGRARARHVGARVERDRARRGALVGGRGVRAPARALTAGAVDFIAAGSLVAHRARTSARSSRASASTGPTRTSSPARARPCSLTPTLGCEAFPHGSRHPEAIGDVPIGYPDLDWAPFLYDANLAGLPPARCRWASATTACPSPCRCSAHARRRRRRAGRRRGGRARGGLRRPPAGARADAVLGPPDGGGKPPQR